MEISVHCKPFVSFIGSSFLRLPTRAHFKKYCTVTKLKWMTTKSRFTSIFSEIELILFTEFFNWFRRFFNLISIRFFLCYIKNQAVLCSFSRWWLFFILIFFINFFVDIFNVESILMLTNQFASLCNIWYFQNTVFWWCLMSHHKFFPFSGIILMYEMVY